jgi:hypothetical protein
VFQTNSGADTASVGPGHSRGVRWAVGAKLPLCAGNVAVSMFTWKADWPNGPQVLQFLSHDNGLETDSKNSLQSSLGDRRQWSHATLAINRCSNRGGYQIARLQSKDIRRSLLLEKQVGRNQTWVPNTGLTDAVDELDTPSNNVVCMYRTVWPRSRS